ncbi:MAG: hypothetical protein PHQ43_07915 [Dehalococcoidales bacterium]|nr:hypothetical protein [Dehalococcoidales bacterium]
MDSTIPAITLASTAALVQPLAHIVRSFYTNPATGQAPLKWDYLTYLGVGLAVNVPIGVWQSVGIVPSVIFGISAGLSASGLYQAGSAIKKEFKRRRKHSHG